MLAFGNTASSYWQRMEETNADVDPFPFVPAICIASSELKSEGYQPVASVKFLN